MEGSILLTLNNELVAKISADDNPKLFLDLIGAARQGALASTSIAVGRTTPGHKPSVMSSRSKPTARSSSNGHAASPRASKNGVADVRTPAGRQALDEELYQALKGEEWKRLETIALHEKYTSVQIRQSARRLVDAKRLARRGMARATEYRTK
jgi:hypothetical protein